jgi:hypothetical protein
LKDPDTENLDSGWDDVPSVPAKAPIVTSAPPAGLAEVDAGWDDSSSDDAVSEEVLPVTKPAAATSPRFETNAATRPERLSKRERRAFERQKRLESDRRRAERKLEEKRARKEAARRSAEEREAERRAARERAERARLKEARRSQKSRSRAESAPRRAEKSRKRDDDEREAPPSAEARSHRRFTMPNGGWIVFAIGLITLGTAWFAFSR